MSLNQFADIVDQLPGGFAELRDSYQPVLQYLLDSESSDLADSAEENDWSDAQCLELHVLGHALAAAEQLGLTHGYTALETVRQIREERG